MKFNLSFEDSNVLRGLAIIAVLLIHIFAFLKGAYTTSPYPLFFIGLDQLSRFCVPLFIMLSGYGLAKKYEHESIDGVRYLKSRFKKLIPLYLLWSLVSFVVFMFVPEWQFANQPESLVLQLIFGQADYQLYFLPVIFQFYLLFPFILTLIKRWPVATLLTAMLVQFAFYTLISGWWPSLPLPKFLSTDQTQYMFFVTWLGYFVLGMWLVQAAISETIRKCLPAVAVIGAWFVIYTAAVDIKNQVDPIIALRFTRLPVMLYAVGAGLTLLMHRSSLPFFRSGRAVVKTLLGRLGKESYLIFLAHTIALRVIFSAVNQEINLPLLAAVSCVWLLTIIISRKLL